MARQASMHNVTEQTLTVQWQYALVYATTASYEYVVYHYRHSLSLPSATFKDLHGQF